MTTVGPIIEEHAVPEHAVAGMGVFTEIVTIR